MKETKLQALIGAIKNLYMQSKLRLLTCWQQAVGKTDCVDDVCCDCKKNIILDGNFDINNMALDRNDYILANEIVDKIMKETIVSNIESKLIELCKPIENENRKLFLIHLNTVFLNILLNRLDEFTPKTRENAILARSIINRLK